MGKNRNTFLKAFLTLHYRGIESRFGEKTENFFEIFSVPTHHWRSIVCLAENSGDFLFSTPLWRWEKRFDEEIIYFYEISAVLTYLGEMSTPHYSTEDGITVWPKTTEIFWPPPISENGPKIEPFRTNLFFFSLLSHGGGVFAEQTKKAVFSQKNSARRLLSIHLFVLRRL